jgi:hypothetical protein
MMRNFAAQKKLIIGGLIALLLADGALAYFSMKTSVPRDMREQSLTAQTREVALIKADIERAKKIQQAMPETLKKFEEFEGTLLPAAKGYSVISQEMDEYAKDARVIVEDVKFHEKEVAGRSLSEVVVESTVSGDYNGIVIYLNRLQRSKNVYIVDELAVDSQNQSQGPPGTLRVNLHLRTYFRKA